MFSVNVVNLSESSCVHQSVNIPFLSYSGSFTLTLFISLGLVQAISIENMKDLMKKQKELISK